MDTGAEDFKASVWQEDSVYVDDENAFKMALGGKQYKNSWLLSFSVIKRILRTKHLGVKQDDMNDKTSYLGGTILVKNSDIVFKQTENSSFMYASPDEVLGAV